MALGFLSLRMNVGLENPVKFNQEDLHYTPVEINVEEISK